MSRVALIGENSVEYINALLDIWNSGDCAVLLDWRIPSQTASEMMHEANVRKCYIEDKYLSNFLEQENRSIEFISYKLKSNSAVLLPETIYRKFRINDSKDEAVVIYSSGTTGKSKGVILSHFAINTNANAIIDYMHLLEDDCLYIAKSLSHSSTLTGELLVALKSGIKLVIAPIIVPPRYILGNISKFRVTIMCLNPTLLSMVVDEAQRSFYDTAMLRTIYVSGSILTDKIYSRAHATFSKISIYNVYGLSEAGPRISAQQNHCCKQNSVGKPIKGVEVVIIDPYGQPLSNGARGIVHVKTQSMYNGYISGTSKHRSLYKGWLNTGDYGYIDKYDELHITDRCDDVITIDSHKIYPSEVEKQILQNADIEECIVVPVEINGKSFLGCLYIAQCEIHNIKQRLTKVLMTFEIPRLFMKCDSFPRTMNGKVSRKKARDLFIRLLKQRDSNDNRTD